MRGLKKNRLEKFPFLLLFVWFLLNPYVAFAGIDNDVQEAFRRTVLDRRKTILYPLSNSVEIDFASDNENNLYIPISNGNLISISLKDNQKRWQTDLGNRIVSSPLILDDQVFITETSGKELILSSIYAATGITNWQTRIPSKIHTEERKTRIFIYNSVDNLILVGDNGSIFAVSKKDRKLIFEKNLSGNLSCMPVYTSKDKNILLGTVDSRLINLDLEEMKIADNLQLSSPPTAISRSSNDDQTFIGDKKGYVSLIDWRRKNAIRKLRVGGEISTLTATEKGLLVTSLDNFAYLLTDNGKKNVWKKRMDGRIVNSPQISNGRVTLIATESPIASVIELETGKILDKIVLKDGDFFTGNTLETADFAVFSTSKGILSFVKTE